MKKTFLLAFVLMNSFTAQASFPIFYNKAINDASPINWQAGDSSDYNLKMLFFTGTLHKEVNEDEGNGVWLTQTINLMGKTEETQLLIDRDTGEILKMIRNGKEENPPENPRLEIIEQNREEVTVPGGTFNSIHIVAKTKDVKRIEIWDNPRAVVIDGVIKEIVSSEIGDITSELTEQHRSDE